MRFSSLKPILGSSTRTKPGEPYWWVHFNCPDCGVGTSVEVSGRPAGGSVFKITPDPLALQDMVQSGSDILAQWSNIWDHVTIEPSIKEPPHPRQRPCRSHFSIVKGEVLPA